MRLKKDTSGVARYSLTLLDCRPLMTGRVTRVNENAIEQGKYSIEREPIDQSPYWGFS